MVIAYFNYKAFLACEDYFKDEIIFITIADSRLLEKGILI